jgi:aminopeptidase N
MKIKITLLLFLVYSYAFSQVSDKKGITGDIAEQEAKSYLPFNLNTSLVVNNYDLKYHRCEWNVDPNNNFISGSITSYFVPTVNGVNQIEFDFSTIMNVDSAIFHGNVVAHSHSNNVLQISFPTSLNIGTLDSVTVYYKGSPIATGFGSFTQSFHNSIPIISTLSEPYGAMDWWPCKQSLDDKIDSVDIIITTPNQYRAGTNGVLISETASGNNKIYHWQSHYPIAAYLIGIAVTNYAVYSDYLPLNPTDTLEILNYVYPEDSAGAILETPFIKDVISLYDSLFITYPFYREKYGHCQWNIGGGQEHQTMSFVSDFSAPLIAHECAHQWFGDFVTCASFQDVWLNEGFATYLEALTQEFLFQPANWTFWKSNTRDVITSFPDGSVFCTDTSSVSRIFDTRLTYEKGAFLLHMLRWKLGDSLFFQGCRNYLNDPSLAFGYAKTDDLKNHLETISGLPLTNFFDQWYYNQGHPTYFINWNVIGNDLFLKIDQTQSDPSVSYFQMPVAIEFQNGASDTTIVFDNTFAGQLFQTTIGFTPTIVTFDPEIWLLSANNAVTFDPTLSTNELGLSRQLINVYPNPVLNKFTIENNGRAVEAKIVLKNSIGQNILLESKLLSEGKNEINLSGIAKGIYILSIKAEGFTLNKKIVKE